MRFSIATHPSQSSKMPFALTSIWRSIAPFPPDTLFCKATPLAFWLSSFLRHSYIEHDSLYNADFLLRAEWRFAAERTGLPRIGSQQALRSANRHCRDPDRRLVLLQGRELASESRRQANHPVAAKRDAPVQSPKWSGGFRRDRTFNLADVNDQLWVGCCRKPAVYVLIIVSSSFVRWW